MVLSWIRMKYLPQDVHQYKQISGTRSCVWCFIWSIINSPQIQLRVISSCSVFYAIRITYFFFWRRKQIEILSSACKIHNDHVPNKTEDDFSLYHQLQKLKIAHGYTKSTWLEKGFVFRSYIYRDLSIFLYKISFGFL